MKPNTLRWLGASVVVTAAVVCWYLLTMEPDSAPQSRGKTLATASRVSEKRPALNPAKQWPVYGTPEFKSMVLDHGPNWLDSRKRDAASLIAMWDITGDEALLAEAAEKFPGDPRVCLIMIQHAGGAPKAVAWIERLIAAEPGNPEGFYLKAWALNKSRDRAGAIAALRAAAAMKTPRDNHIRERTRGIREAALGCGGRERDAAYCSLGGPLDCSLTRASLHGAISAILGEMNEATANRDEARLMDRAGLGLAMVGSISRPSGGLVFTAIVANSTELDILRRLPDDTEVGIAGLTVAQMKLEGMTRRRELTQLNDPINDASSVLETAGDAVLTEYVERFASQGQEAAVQWLLEQPGPGK